MSENIISVNLLDQYNEDQIIYMLYVLRNRVVPSPFDGLKPVQRKLLYGTYNDVKAIKSTIKSTAILGNIMDKYHPHGDSGIYGSIKTMVNWFEIYCPLFSKQGSFGNFQGESASAPRYTEVRISDFALDCVISDLSLSKSAVDWVDTYDNRYKEPEFLPVAVPLLLINGSFGIAVGLKVEIPSHNFNEVIDATIKLIKNPNADIVLIPDHCMDCEIIDNNTNFKAITRTGAGHYTVRGKIEITEYEGKPALAIKSLPNMTFFNNIRDKILELIESNKLIQVHDIKENSDKDNLNTYIVLKKGSDANYVRDVIYKNTDMLQRCRVNFEALVDKLPVRFSYVSYLQYFIEFRKLTKFRLYCNKLQDVLTKIHEKELYIKVLKSGYIDDIIKMIRKQTGINDNDLVEFLIKKLDVTDLQAKFVLGTDIRKLSIGYLDKYIQDSESLKIEAANYQKMLLEDESLIENEIIAELEYFKKKYGGPRRCKVLKQSDIADIPQGQFKIIVTENNFIKKVQVNDGLGSFKGDAPKIILIADNTENIIIFDEMGKVFKLPVHKISFSDKNSNGIDIRLLLKNLTSNINTVIYEPILKSFTEKSAKFFITTVTNNGYIKKLDIEDFLAITPSGMLYTKLDSGDFVKDIMIVNEKADIIIYSSNKALRINLSEVPHLKRNTKGNKAMSTNSGIEGLSVIKNDTTDIIVITDTGRINRFSTLALPLSNRAKAGSTVIKLGKTDRIRAIYGLNTNDSVKVITKNNKFIIPVKDIPEGSSISTGAKVIPMKDDLIIRCESIKGE